jgi:putative DNA primase/helicase
MTTLRDAALQCARRGWQVFPLRPGSKVPLSGTRGYLDATTHEPTIRQWWSGTDGVNCNIGVATTRTSGLWVLDCDVDEAGSPIGETTLEQLVAEHGALPPHPIQETPRCGLHHLFAWPADDKDLPRKIRGLPGLDVLGSRREGGVEKAGYFVIAPSYRSEGDYRWLKSPDSVPLVPAPDWLVELLRSSIDEGERTERPLRPPTPSGATTVYGRVALDGLCNSVRSCPPGSQDDNLIQRATRLGGLIAGGHIDKSEGVDALVAAGMAMANQGGRPPWTRRVVADKVHRGVRYGEASPSGPVIETPRVQAHTPAHGGGSPQATATTPDESAQFPGNPAPEILYLGLDQVTLRPVEWLWENWLARGKLCMIAGDSGVGKSQMTCRLMAALSTGAAWPDGRAAPQGSVVFIGSEDGVDDTVLPRIMAVGANLSRIKYVQGVKDVAGKRRTMNVPLDLAPLSQMIKKIGDVLMVCFDPITAYLGNIDSHRTSDVRGALEPLNDFASEHNVAVLMISHPTKAGAGKAINAVTGSSAFSAIVRTLAIMGDDPNDAAGKRRVLVSGKNNLGPLPNGVGYVIEPCKVGNDVATARLAFDQAPVQVTADELVKGGQDDEAKSSLQDAKDFLIGILAAGSKAFDEIMLEAKTRGISQKTLYRAKKELGIKSVRTNFSGGWLWEIPNTPFH